MGRLFDWYTGAGIPSETRSDEPLPSDPSTAITPPPRKIIRETVTTDEALSLSMVYRAIQIISVSAKQISFDAYRDGTELSPQPAIVRQPNIDSPRSAFIEETTTSLAVSGNAYWLIDRDASGRVSNLSVLDPHFMTIEATNWGTVTGYFYKGKEFSRDAIKHLKLTRFPGHVKGLGPIQAAQRELRGALDTRDYSANWFQDSGVPSGVLSSDQHLNPEQAEAYRTRWHETNGATRDVAVLGAGLSYAPVFLDPEDAQWIQARQYDTTSIARMFGVPSSLMLATVEGNSQTYSNVEQDWLSYTRYALISYLNEIEDAMSDLLPRGQRVRFNIEALLRADTASRYAAHAVALSSGFMSKNEVRDIEGLGPIPGGGFSTPSNTPTPSVSAFPEVEDAPEESTNV